MINAISPVDGRYAHKIADLSEYFSEKALMKYRVLVEIEYFIALVNLDKMELLRDFPRSKFSSLRKLYESFDSESALEIGRIESKTNHDVKAVEYWIKDRFEAISLESYKEYIHFGLTSQDINNVAIPLMLKDALKEVYLIKLKELTQTLSEHISKWGDVPMLAHTHGQPASPTKLGKEYRVFLARIERQRNDLERLRFHAKFGGASGNFNAHMVSHPEIDWNEFAIQFLKNFDLERSFPTTQIDHYDGLSAVMHNLIRINNVLKDLCIDTWLYISMGYFRQKKREHEVGSSAMPHKVNPIDFENAEGNIGISNALWNHISDTLPVSRLQRDLTDSTVLRNLGVPLAHAVISILSMVKGLNKLVVNRDKIDRDLSENWSVLAEAIQTILKREAYPKPYEALKDLTRGKAYVSKEMMHEFIQNLNVREDLKRELLKLTPQNYTGNA